MNERIEQLVQGALVAHEQEGILLPIVLEKFAELIVRETLMQMAIQMDKFGDEQSNNAAWYKSEEAVKNYFGVEE